MVFDSIGSIVILISANTQRVCDGQIIVLWVRGVGKLEIRHHQAWQMGAFIMTQCNFINSQARRAIFVLLEMRNIWNSSASAIWSNSMDKAGLKCEPLDPSICRWFQILSHRECDCMLGKVLPEVLMPS